MSKWNMVMTLVALTVLGVSPAASAESLQRQVVHEGKELRRMALQLERDRVGRTAAFMERLDELSRQQPERTSAVRYLQMLACIALDQDETLESLQEALREGPAAIEDPYWKEALKLTIADEAPDGAELQDALRGKGMVTIAVSMAGKPYTGTLRWRSLDDAAAGGLILLDEGNAGPFLLPVGDVALRAEHAGRVIELGTTSIAAWSTMKLKLSVPEDDQLTILSPVDGAVIDDGERPTFRWRYDPGEGERIVVSVARKMQGTSWLTIWGPVEVAGRQAVFGEGKAPQEELRSGEDYELVVTILSPPKREAGPDAPEQARSRARRFRYEPGGHQE